MTKALERAKEFERQLSELLSLVNHKDFASIYDGDVDETKALLKKHLITLRVDMQQMSDVDEANFFAGDPRFYHANRPLILDVEAIGVDLEFEINPKLESTARQLAEKAKKAEAGDKGLLQQTLEALDKAIEMIASPIAKAAALTTAIKALMDFSQTVPR